jgi:hypothetical protein
MLLLGRQFAREETLNETPVDVAEILTNVQKWSLLVAGHVHDHGVQTAK